MKPKSIYIAGPMTGVPYFNFPLFFKAADRYRDAGFRVFNPAEADIKRHGGVDISKDNPTGDPKLAAANHNFDLGQALREDTEFICLHATHICMLPGWENSKGARAEHALAHALGHTILYWQE